MKRTFAFTLSKTFKNYSNIEDQDQDPDPGDLYQNLSGNGGSGYVCKIRIRNPAMYPKRQIIQCPLAKA